MGERGILDEIGDALADVQAKLIEEGWFGRRTPTAQGRDLGREWSGPSIHDTPGDLPRGPGFEEAWAPHDGAAEHSPDTGIDR